MEVFIREYQSAISKELCKEIITRFENEPGIHPGRTLSGLKEDVKKSVDFYLTNSWKDIDNELFESSKKHVGLYLEEFNHARFDKYLLSDCGYQVQKYFKGNGYYNWHVDAGPKRTDRQFAAIWYLNSVEEGGETEFKYQDIRVKPEAGKIVLFPTAWTHYHRGAMPVSSDKYIVTTFFKHKID